MTVEELAQLIPEEKQEEAKQLLGKAVFIESKEDARKLADDNQHLRSIIDSFTSSRVENALARKAETEKERVEELAKQRLKELNPSKEPWQIELEEMKAELDKTKRSARQKELTALAVSKAQELGLPSKPEFISKFIGEDEESTLAALDSLAGETLAPWRDSAVKETREKLISGAGKPGQGSASDKTISRAEWASLNPKEKAEKARAGVKLADD